MCCVYFPDVQDEGGVVGDGDGNGDGGTSSGFPYFWWSFCPYLDQVQNEVCFLFRRNGGYFMHCYSSGNG